MMIMMMMTRGKRRCVTRGIFTSGHQARDVKVLALAALAGPVGQRALRPLAGFLARVGSELRGLLSRLLLLLLLLSWFLSLTLFLFLTLALSLLLRLLSLLLFLFLALLLLLLRLELFLSLFLSLTATMLLLL